MTSISDVDGFNVNRKINMVRFVFWIMAVLLILPASANNNEDDAQPSTPQEGSFVQESIVRAHQRLTTGLYKSLARRRGNLLLSPWSVMTLLTVAYMVAGGRTATEIGDHLRINLLRRKEIIQGFEHINEIIQSGVNDSTEIMESVNGAFIGRKVKPKRRLERALRENLNTYIQSVITNEPDDNSTTVEGDAFQNLLREKTLGQLDRVLPTDAELAGNTSLWLFNVIHFQGAWRTPFNPIHTHVSTFLVDGKRPASVVTMVSRASYPRRHYDDIKATLLELPYGQAGRYGFFILLPDQPDGLPEVEKRLKSFSLESMLATRHWSRQARVYLPRFKFLTNVLLNGVMKRLGFKRMFSPRNADFTRLDPKRPPGAKSPYVRTMVHRAAIEVNENGTTASAATAMRLASRRYIHRFQVNHPFMFILRDKKLGINLFIGRVTDPRELS